MIIASALDVVCKSSGSGEATPLGLWLTFAGVCITALAALLAARFGRNSELLGAGNRARLEDARRRTHKIEQATTNGETGLPPAPPIEPGGTGPGVGA